jgi:hypothetical protein
MDPSKTIAQPRRRTFHSELGAACRFESADSHSSPNDNRYAGGDSRRARSSCPLPPFTPLFAPFVALFPRCCAVGPAAPGPLIVHRPISPRLLKNRQSRFRRAESRHRRLRPARFSEEPAACPRSHRTIAQRQNIGRTLDARWRQRSQRLGRLIFDHRRRAGGSTSLDTGGLSAVRRSPNRYSAEAAEAAATDRAESPCAFRHDERLGNLGNLCGEHGTTAAAYSAAPDPGRQG